VSTQNSFKALLIKEAEGKVRHDLGQWSVDRLDAGEVLIRVAYSSVNYKDALAATGAGKIIRRFPCIGGIDLSGVVESSSDPRFKGGDRVIATSFDIGVAHHGGYAEYARVPAGWVVPLPKSMSLRDAMALGTAGFTAALGVVRMEENGLAPGNGPVIVTGATGGVGSLSINMLAQKGFKVTALTGKESESAYLRDLGASDIVLRSSLDLTKIRPLDKSMWAGAVDNLGGDYLAWILANMQQGGTVASIGLAASMKLNTTVAPFILRGACLLGIDSGYIGFPKRQQVWDRLASDLWPQKLQGMTREIDLDDVPAVFQEFLGAQVKGRTVVRVGGDV
jgi:acrylyl-CoA reductase (NADPH)